MSVRCLSNTSRVLLIMIVGKAKKMLSNDTCNIITVGRYSTPNNLIIKSFPAKIDPKVIGKIIKKINLIADPVTVIIFLISW